MSKKLTALAQLIEVLAEKGITTTSALVERTGYTDRAIRKARAELECRNQGAAGTIVPEPGCRPGTRVPQTEPECRNQGAALARAYIESPSEITLTPEVKKESPKPPQGASNDFWKTAFETVEPHETIVRTEAGGIQLINGTRQFWLDEFGGDAKRLDLALITIAGEINHGSRKPLAADVQARLARVAAQIHDQNKRYASAVAANAASKAVASGHAVESPSQKVARLSAQSKLKEKSSEHTRAVR